MIEKSLVRSKGNQINCKLSTTCGTCTDILQNDIYFFSYPFMSHYDTPMARKDNQHVFELSPKLDPPKKLIVVQRL